MIRIAPWRIWKWMLSRRWHEKRVGIFRNRPDMIPGRWGFRILGFELGSRNSRNKTGLWLRDHGLWPW